MIDTIKVKVEVPDETMKNIKRCSVQTTRKDHVLGSNTLNYFNTHIDLPSYTRGVNIFHDAYKENTIFFEFSIPKITYNHNIMLVDIPQAIQTLYNLHDVFTKKFGKFPDPKTWDIIRLDLCYAWKLKTPDHAKSLIKILQTYQYPRKKNSNYETSVYAWSRLSTVKFYLKRDEFRANDFNILRREVSEEYAHELLNMSESVLRYEVELRRQQLKREYKSSILTYENVFSEAKIIAILQKYFSKFMSYQNTGITTDNDNYKKLIKYTRSSAEAVQLLAFYKLLHSASPNDREFIKTNYSRTTIYRKKLLIKKVGLGLVPENNELAYFDFSIPSKFNVNAYLVPVDEVNRHDVRSVSNTRTNVSSMQHQPQKKGGVK